MLAFLESHPALTEAFVLLLWLAAAALILHAAKPAGHYKGPKHSQRYYQTHKKV